ncbi:protein-disulfide reductase DsbD [Modicisalibacter xianhensis]|uniref:Thiol:disulfide interchange protein DsbD n=1 Tax=Modicisalibacter xianhensis TaxID=442341 RepID=A0A1I2Z545_9GAMM|nr:protein-disulfide reductase DsbD [Halomonas xianhensis]SFH32131.1 thiol:disulfide interchange protein DsbD [Halomonas xianhensis]
MSEHGTVGRLSRKRALWLVSLILLACLSFSASAAEDFLPVEEAFKLTTEQRNGEVALRWEIAPGYYLYRHRLEITGEPVDIEEPELPEGTPISDEYFGDSQVYYRTLQLNVDPGQARRLELTWQGCAEDGLCYAPQHRTLEVESSPSSSRALDAIGKAPTLPGKTTPQVGETPVADASDRTTSALGEDQRLAARLADAHAGWMLAAFFGMGLLLVFTPCVLPMLPILSSLVVGSGTGAKRGLWLSLAFVVPMALTYAVLGVAAAQAGANLQAMLQTPWLLGAFALLFVVFALAMFGLFELQLPGMLRQRLDRLQSRQQGGTLGGAAIMGVLSALLVGPCMTAPLAGALLYIADTGDTLLGGAALLMLGLGMGTPLLLVGVLGARLLPRPGPWMVRVKVLFGFVLLGMAVWFLTRVVSGPVELGLWGLWLLGVAVALWHASRRSTPGVGHQMMMTVGLALGIWGAAMLLGAAGGGTNPFQPLAYLQSGSGGQGAAERDIMARFDKVENLASLNRRIDQAGQQGQWTLVDIYAEWCVSCKVIEEEVFGNPRVQAQLETMQLLRPDVTANDATDRELLDAHGILGPPTLMLFGPDGEERRAQRIVGEITADAFLERLEQARQASGRKT